MNKASKERIDRILERVLDDPDDYENKPGALILRLYRDYLKPYRVFLLIAFFVTIVWSLQPYAIAVLNRYLVDGILMVEKGFEPDQFPAQLDKLMFYGGTLLSIWLIFVVSHWVRNFLIMKAGWGMVYKLRQDLHEKLQRLHVGFFERIETGKLMSRVLDDVKVIRSWSTNEFLNVVANIFRLVLGMGILFYLNWKLTSIIIVSMPLYAYTFARIRPLIKNVSIGIRRLNSNMYAMSQERIGGINVVKAFAQEGRERAAFAGLMHDRIRLSMRSIYYSQGLVLISSLITAVVSGATIYFGLTQVKSGVMSLGDVVVFIDALPVMFQQVNALANIYTSIQAVFVVIGRVFYLLDTEEKVVTGHIQLTGMKGKVFFDNVSFSYPGTEVSALKNVTFRVNPGEKVALMGPSGAGKTTVFQLLTRFYDPVEGIVRVGGVNLVDADTTSLRRHVCIVQQEPVLFSGTIADNIAYGQDGNATPEQIMTSTKQAELHDFVMTLPVKYETEVGRNGVSLSGGQKQRLALATALLTEPEVLLLDDTTSALDAETEARIRETLNKVLKDRTSIIITQRIATARDCDKIIVLEEGRITQMGNHEELLQQEGFYKRIFLQQESI